MPSIKFRMANARRRVETILEERPAFIANELRNEIVLLLRQPGTGEVYEKYKPRRTHRASRPGAPPATDIGGLIQGIGARQLNQYAWRVHSDAPYSDDLEYGTRTIDPRPFFRPAYDTVRARLRSGS